MRPAAIFIKLQRKCRNKRNENAETKEKVHLCFSSSRTLVLSTKHHLKMKLCEYENMRIWVYDYMSICGYEYMRIWGLFWNGLTPQSRWKRGFRGIRGSSSGCPRRSRWSRPSRRQTPRSGCSVHRTGRAVLPWWN